METKQKRRKVVVSLLALVGLLVFSLSTVAGSLEPSAAPGPTMKTLNEVEPKIPIHDSDLPLTITEPNSYYLVEDISFTDDANDAITIECNDVTIDLMGYTLKGPDSGTKGGIYMNGCSNVEIRNGTVRNFGSYGIYEAGFINGKEHRIIDVRSVSNGPRGIYLDGKGHLVKDCTASDNGTSASLYVYGIYVSEGSTVTGNKAYNNGTSATGGYIYGIYAGDGSTVTGNTAYDNGNSAISSVYGVYAGYGSTVTGNTAYYNGTSATGALVYGIHANSGSTVTSNTAHNNGHLAGFTTVCGIKAGSGCTVTGNTCYSNVHFGISTSSNCLVDQNTAVGNGSTNMLTGVGCVLGLNCAP